MELPWLNKAYYYYYIYYIYLQSQVKSLRQMMVFNVLLVVVFD